MILNILILILFIALTVFLAWSALRLARSRHRLVKWLGAPLLSLLAGLFLIVSGVTGRGLYLLYMPKSGLIPDLTIQGTADQIARGQEIAQTLCVSCHSANGELPLIGGNASLGTDAGLNLGALYPPNLTPGGQLKNVTDGEIWRIFRSGIHPSGRSILMPVATISHLSDDDLKAVIAYLRSQPAVDNQVPAINPNIVLALLVGSNVFNLQFTPITAPVVAPPKGPTAEYGQYIVSYNDCIVCHGDKLDGHPSGPVTPGPDVRVVKSWSADQFIQTMRTGVDPTGHQLQLPMPWKALGMMDDTELTAMYMYLKGLE